MPNLPLGEDQAFFPGKSVERRSCLLIGVLASQHKARSVPKGVDRHESLRPSSSFFVVGALGLWLRTLPTATISRVPATILRA